MADHNPGSSDTILPPAMGDPAPDFTAPTGGGATLRLGDYLGHKPVVLYFYPKDDTPGCTAEACAFRDQRQDFEGAGAVIIGVSGDPAESHDRFTAKYSLAFPLVSDSDGHVRRLYGVEPHGALPKRATFVIDAAGIVRGIFSSLPSATTHVDRALAALRH